MEERGGDGAERDEEHGETDRHREVQAEARVEMALGIARRHHVLRRAEPAEEVGKFVAERGQRERAEVAGGEQSGERDPREEAEELLAARTHEEPEGAFVDGGADGGGGCDVHGVKGRATVERGGGGVKAAPWL